MAFFCRYYYERPDEHHEQVRVAGTPCSACVVGFRPHKSISSRSLKSTDFYQLRGRDEAHESSCSSSSAHSTAVHSSDEAMSASHSFRDSPAIAPAAAHVSGLPAPVEAATMSTSAEEL